jgi:hypothetical protein
VFSNNRLLRLGDRSGAPAYVFWSLAAGILAVAVVLLLSAGGPGRFLVPSGGYTLSGSFAVNGAHTLARFRNAADAADPAFGSWAGSDFNTGAFQSSVFRAPDDLDFCVAGYPSKDGISLYLEDVSQGRKLRLKTQFDPAETWTRFAWSLPRDWRGNSVRLVAEDQARVEAGWVAVTLPRQGGAETRLYSFEYAAGLVGELGIETFLYLLPGFAVALFLHRRFALDPIRFACAAFIASAAAGYLAFWAYFASVIAGKAYTALLFGVTALYVVACWRDWRRFRETVREFSTAVLLTLLAASFYLGLGYLYKFDKDAGVQAQRRILWQLPPDNVLPYLFAERIYLHQPLRPYLFANWKSSDRPPLQTGISLEEYPTWMLFGRAIDYELLAVVLQSTWIASLWLFLRFADVRRRTIVLVLFFSLFSGFFFLHSYYVWPKLLASSLVLLALTFTPFARPGYKWTGFDIVLAAAALTLGLLSHTGVIFSAPGILFVLYGLGELPPRRVLAWAAGVILLLWLPWAMYQKVYDPPGDLLLKLHLAGSLDERHSFASLLFGNYSKLGLGQLIANKLANFQVLFLRDSSGLMIGGNSIQRVNAFLEGNFFCLFQALGLLNLGLVIRFCRRCFRQSTAAIELELSLANRLIAAVLVSTVVWCVAMFGPGGALIHQGSLLNVALLFVGFALPLICFLPRFTLILLILQAAVVFPIFVFAKPFMQSAPGMLLDGVPDRSFGAAAVISMGGLLLWGFHTAFLPEQSPEIERVAALTAETTATRKLYGPSLP